MDIVVTIPQKQTSKDDRELPFKSEHVQAFWSCNKKPIHLDVYDRVYFVKKGRVVSSMRVIGVMEERETLMHADEKKRQKPKIHIMLDDYTPENLSIETTGFQGFRYKWW